MRKTQTGKLDRIITIQQHVTGTDENGYPFEDWVEFTKTWSGKRGLSGREYYAAAAVQHENDEIYAVRYDSMTRQITADMRIVDGETYNIQSIVDKDGRKQWLEIRAVTAVV